MTNPPDYFELSNLLYNKVDFAVSNFKAAMELQIEVAGKINLATGILDLWTIQNCFA